MSEDVVYSKQIIKTKQRKKIRKEIVRNQKQK